MSVSEHVSERACEHLCECVYECVCMSVCKCLYVCVIVHVYEFMHTDACACMILTPVGWKGSACLSASGHLC